MRTDLQHDVTRHLMTIAARLQSLPMGKRLVLKIGESLDLHLRLGILIHLSMTERNNGGRYTFTRNEEDHRTHRSAVQIPTSSS